MIPVICPSKGRAGTVMTHEAVSPLILCISENERQAYAEAYPDIELLVHPDDVVGLSPKRQWICDQVGDVFMVDDDLFALVQTYEPAIPSRLHPEHAFEVIQHVGGVAKQMGVYLWGLANSHDARYYDANRPFRMSGFLNGYAFGLFTGSRIKFPTEADCTVADYVISGINAFYHRKIWADTRWGFQQKGTFHTPGGLGTYRSLESEERWFNELRRMFGAAIVRKVKPRTAGRAANQTEKLLAIPW